MTSISSAEGRVTFSRRWATTSSANRITGVRKRSARLKAVTVSSKHSATPAGQSTTAGWSPWVPQRACCTSPWATLVGMPVLGPARITLTTTSGVSVMAA
jgi:hypothetical protein